MALASIRLEEDDGMVQVETPDGKQLLDLYLTHDQLVGVNKQYENSQPEEYHQALCNYLSQRGVPGAGTMSFRQVTRLMELIFGLVEELKKKDAAVGGEPSPALPKPTELTL